MFQHTAGPVPWLLTTQLWGIDVQLRLSCRTTTYIERAGCMKTHERTHFVDFKKLTPPMFTLRVYATITCLQFRLGHVTWPILVFISRSATVRDQFRSLCLAPAAQRLHSKHELWSFVAHKTRCKTAASEDHYSASLHAPASAPLHFAHESRFSSLVKMAWTKSP